MAGFGRILSLFGENLISRNAVPIRNVSVTSTFHKSKPRILEEMGIPAKPKRPVPPFLMYVQIERNKLKENGKPVPSQKDFLKSAGLNWTKLNPEFKESLMKQHDENMLSYTKKLMEYDRLLSEDQKKKIADIDTYIQDRKLRSTYKKRLEELGKPKKPPSPFLYYLMETPRRSDLNRMEFVKKCASNWHAMSPNEKAKWEGECTKLMVQYKQEIRDWEEKMVRLGHIDVVRNRGLIDLKSSKAE